jgi:hypothetical protein
VQHNARVALPILDEHSATFPTDRPTVWHAVRRYGEALTRTERPVLGRLLGARPRSGFALAGEVEPERLVLAGEHRFARYQLVFELRGESERATTLSVRSLAEFPGVRGRTYRALLMGTRGHVVAVRHMLGTIRRELGR